MKTTTVEIAIDSVSAQLNAETSEHPSQALDALSILEKTAPQAYAHLRLALSRQDTQIVVPVLPHLICRSAFATCRTP